MLPLLLCYSSLFAWHWDICPQRNQSVTHSHILWMNFLQNIYFPEVLQIEEKVPAFLPKPQPDGAAAFLRDHQLQNVSFETIKSKVQDQILLILKRM